MKKITVNFLFFVAFAQLHAQDYLIGFSATGWASTIDTILVQNLTQTTTLTINGTDILHLVGTVGMEQILPDDRYPLSISPNPMLESCIVGFDAVVSGMTLIEVYDPAGKRVIQANEMLVSGWHSFTISGLRSGCYTLRVSSSGYLYTGKIICAKSGSGKVRIETTSVSVQSASGQHNDGTRSVVQMQYNDGDQLLITCYSGIYTTVIPLVPIQSMTVIAGFYPCTDYDGNNYATVTVGSQVWMEQNLNAGTRIDGLQDQSDNGIIEKYCFEDMISNCNIYGGLYQWNEMMQYTTLPGDQGICPSGWHLPTDEEWTILTTFLGGESSAGGPMKETGTGHWASPNGEATNSSGFTALPGGFRFLTGSFSSLTTFAFFWSSSSQVDPGFAWYRDLVYNFGYVYRDGYNKIAGFSVRCVMN